MKTLLTKVALHLMGAHARYQVMAPIFHDGHVINPEIRGARRFEKKPCFINFDGLPNEALKPVNWQASIITKLHRASLPAARSLTGDELGELFKIRASRPQRPMPAVPKNFRRLYDHPSSRRDAA